MATPHSTPFTNPADAAADQAERYVKAVLELLGDREPLAVMDELVPWLDTHVAGLDDPLLRAPEAPGKWSILQVVWHLADSEVISRYRLRTSVAAPGAPIAGYDQDAWADELRYDDEELAPALELIRVNRDHTLRWLRSLDEDALERYGTHAERGRESVRRLVALLAGHDLVHRNQITRIKKTLGAG